MSTDKCARFSVSPESHVCARTQDKLPPDTLAALFFELALAYLAKTTVPRYRQLCFRPSIDPIYAKVDKSKRQAMEKLGGNRRRMNSQVLE